MRNPGEQFIHAFEPKLHISREVEHEQKRCKRKGEQTSQKPAEKLEAWFKVLEKTHGHEDPAILERIKNFYYKKHIIKSQDIPKSYFETQKRLARERGQGDIEITKEMRSAAAEIIIADQKSTIDNWLNYLTSRDSDSFPMWAKYWAFTNMVKLSSYDKGKHAFGKRDKGTVAPFPDLNREALAYVVDAIIKKANKEKIEDADPEFKKLVDSANFGKLYAWAIEKVTPTEENELINIKGEWKKYDRNSDHMPLVKSLQGHGTGWCTAGESTAKTQLYNGDFYVYYSTDKKGNPIIPRIAIRMQGDKIGEVRGIAPDQNLDPYIGDVVKEKLKEFPDGKAYEKKTEDMKLLTQIDKKNQAGQELTTEELKFLYEFEDIIQGFGYEEDPRKAEILKTRDIKYDLGKATGFLSEQISINRDEALSGNIKFHYGDLDLNDLQTAEGLKLPGSINGSLIINELKIVKGLSLPQSIGGGFFLNGLQTVKGLKLPESIGEELGLKSLKTAKGLKLPESFRASLDLSGLKTAEGLNLPQSIGGYLDLRGLQSAKGLNLPQSIGGYLDLGGLKTAEGLNLPQSIGGDLYLRGLQSAKGLNLPQSIGGILDLTSLKSPQDLHLPKLIGEDIYLNGLIDVEGLVLHENFTGKIFLRKIKNLEGITLPENFRGEIFFELPNREFKELQKKYPNLKLKR